MEERVYHVRNKEKNQLEYVNMKTIGFPKKNEGGNTMVSCPAITYTLTKIWVQGKLQ